MNCKNYRGIKLLEHGFKILEKILDTRLRQTIDHNIELSLASLLEMVSLKDKIRNEVLRSRCGIPDIVEKVQEARLRSFGHVLRREDEEPYRMAWNLSVESEVEGSRVRDGAITSRRTSRKKE
ncbi:uncharacterized protein LOC134771938 [Penaeus indicus]|uniref:uncharacterized protein LOC134771938 n=1 Tax=Penaeus indicus TaxID=29960 RepID=UPI00300C709B